MTNGWKSVERLEIVKWLETSGKAKKFVEWLEINEMAGLLWMAGN